MNRFDHHIIYNIIFRNGEKFFGMRFRGITPDGQYIFQGNNTKKNYNFFDGDGSQYFEIGEID